MGTSFWSDRWLNGETLADKFNRLWRLDSNTLVSVADRMEMVGGECRWKWEWRREPRGRELGELEYHTSLLQEWRPSSNGNDKIKWLLSPDGEFSVAHLKTLIEEKLVASGMDEVETCWSKKIPKKIGIFIWRVRRGRIASREVLDQMGIDLDSLLCPRCKNQVETIDHALLRCEEVKRMWSALARWWEVDIGNIGSIKELLNLGNELSGTAALPKLWLETTWAFTYLLWANRNQLIFRRCSKRLEDLFGDFQRKIYEWIEGRIGKRKIDWNVWIVKPRLAIS